MGKHDTSDDRDWLERNQERSHRQITGSGRAGNIARPQEEAIMKQNINVVEEAETLTPKENNEALTPKENNETLAPEERSAPIAKPGEFNLDKFKAKRAAAVANVETLHSALPVHNMAAAKDFVRVHHDEQKYWSDDLCFVEVPIKGQKHNTLHLIDEDLALRFLEAGEIKRFRLALASKPNDVFFLCEVPTQNLDNSWNNTNLEACERAKTLWTKAISRKGEGVENYKITFAKEPDAFREPNWPKQPFFELIERAYAGRTIETEDHPALLRKIGVKQSLS